MLEFEVGINSKRKKKRSFLNVEKKNFWWKPNKWEDKKFVNKFLFKENVEKISTEYAIFLETLPSPILKGNAILRFESYITERELHENMISVAQEKSRENDRLTKEFFKCFLLPA